jgi:hypothetical protein
MEILEHFSPEDGCNMPFRGVGSRVEDHSVPHYRRSESDQASREILAQLLDI